MKLLFSELFATCFIIQLLLANMEQVKDQELGDADDESKNQLEGHDHGMEKSKSMDTEDGNSINLLDQEEEQEEEEMIKKKYGGLLKKKPLIAKDHERAFFDSADWALGKQGAQRPKGPLEALRPKLQPTPHQEVRARRMAYATSHDSEVDDGHHSSEDEIESSTPSDVSNKILASEEQREHLPFKVVM